MSTTLNDHNNITFIWSHKLSLIHRCRLRHLIKLNMFTCSPSIKYESNGFFRRTCLSCEKRGKNWPKRNSSQSANGGIEWASECWFRMISNHVSNQFEPLYYHFSRMVFFQQDKMRRLLINVNWKKQTKQQASVWVEHQQQSAATIVFNFNGH